MPLGFTWAAGLPIGISLTRTTDGFVRNEPWVLEYERILTSVDTVRDHFTIHIRKDLSPEEDLDLQKRLHRSFRIAFNLPTSLQLQRVEPDPEYLWDSFHSTFISNDSSQSFTAKLNIVIGGTDGTYSEEFPLVLILGWVRTLQKPFAVLYGTYKPIATSQGSVRDVVPEDFPNLGRDHVNRNYSRGDTFEDELSSIFSTSRFQATEVQFINAKMMVLHRGVRKSSAYVARFRVQLKTLTDAHDVVSYDVSLSGSLRRLEGREAVSSAYSYVLAKGTDSEREDSRSFQS